MVFGLHSVLIGPHPPDETREESVKDNIKQRLDNHWWAENTRLETPENSQTPVPAERIMCEVISERTDDRQNAPQELRLEIEIDHQSDPFTCIIQLINSNTGRSIGWHFDDTHADIGDAHAEWVNKDGKKEHEPYDPPRENGNAHSQTMVHDILDKIESGEAFRVHPKWKTESES